MRMSILIYLSMFMSIPTALAQDTIDVHGLYTVPNDGDLLDPVSIYRAERNNVNSFGAQVLFEYAKEPAVLMRKPYGFDVASREVIVEDLAALNMGIFYAPDKRLSLGASSPLYLNTNGMGQQTGAAFGDSRLLSTVNLVIPNDDMGFGLSVIPYVIVPGFYDEQNLGLIGAAGGGVAAMSIGNDIWNVSGNIGMEFSPSVEFYNLDGGERLITGIAASYALDDVALRTEGTLRPSVGDNKYNWTDSPAEVIFSIRGYSGNNLDWTAGVSKGISKGVSAADWRILAGMGTSFGSHDVHECKDCQVPESKIITETNTVYMIPPIFFEFDKANIKFPESEVTIDFIAFILKEVQNANIGIVGHADDRGSNDYNIELSKRRVEAVVNVLVEKYGIDSNRIYFNAYGESQSSGCIDEDCHQIDRRVDFIIKE